MNPYPTATQSMALDDFATSQMRRPISASKQFLNTDQSRARYLDFIGFHRARAHGKTLHDDELKEIHEIESEAQAMPAVPEDHALVNMQATTSDEPKFDRAVCAKKRVRVVPDASDSEDLLRARLRNIYASIRKIGREVTRASTYYNAAIALPASQIADNTPGTALPISLMDVVEKALSRYPKRKKKVNGFEDLITQQDQIAEWRYDAMKSEIRHRRGASAKSRESHGEALLLDSDVDFIVQADLAAYLYVNRSKLSMHEIEELWQILVQDVDAKLPYKLTFEQFEMWLLEHHPKLRRMNRFVLSSFATDESFESAFALEETLVERRDEMRKRQARARNKVNCCGCVCVAPIG